MSLVAPSTRARGTRSGDAAGLHLAIPPSLKPPGLTPATERCCNGLEEKVAQTLDLARILCTPPFGSYLSENLLPSPMTPPAQCDLHSTDSYVFTRSAQLLLRMLLTVSATHPATLPTADKRKRPAEAISLRLVGLASFGRCCFYACMALPTSLY